MTNEFIVGLISKLEGYKTRLAELHWSASSHSLHVVINDFQSEIDDFEDAIAENAIALWDFIRPGELKPELPEAKEFEILLEDLRGLLISIKREASDSMMWTGIINRTDDFFEVVNKYIYLTKIIKHESEN